MDISVVIPLFNEEESLKELVDWLKKVLDKEAYKYEIIFIDDGSTDRSFKIIEEMTTGDSNIKVIKFRRNYGKSAALHCGFEKAEGEVVITMDADLQDSPDEIPELYRMIKSDGYDLVSGWKKNRFDPTLSKNIPSKIYNWAARKVSGIKLHDFNCGLKAYRNEVVKNLELYGDMHRYIPVIAKQAGYNKIGEKVVTHQKRKYGVTKFGIERFFNGFLDLLTLYFINKFGKRPMHFFGTMGTLIFMTGSFVSFYLIFQKIYRIAHKLPIREVTDQPLFYLALVTLIIGVQLFLTGFIAELVSRNSTDRNNYQVEKMIF